MANMNRWTAAEQTARTQRIMRQSRTSDVDTYGGYANALQNL